jgi:hypothetical protein
MRWFPELDESGKPVPWTPEPPREIESASADAFGNPGQHTAGYWYVLNRGNTLQDVVAAAYANHQLTLTVEEVQRDNPAANPNRLKGGQKIFVSASLPRTIQNSEEETPPPTIDGSAPAR